MRVVPVPVLDDNYAYLIIDDKTKHAIAVDPAQPEKVIAAAEKEGVEIKTVATTHHHWDHAGGNTEMKKRIPHLEILGGDDRIDSTRKVGHGDEYALDDLRLKVYFTPCHTSGHVLYLVHNVGTPDTSVLFTGDTLFIGGCGRFFEGTAEQMDYALNTVVASLPHDTLVYCGHEYTVKNLEFSLSIEPNNQDIKNKLAWAKERVANKQYTIPSRVGEELTYNPFMRVRTPELKDIFPALNPTQIMAELRSRKNNF